MKYKARIEKLDWKGRVRVSFREFEDKFKPNFDGLLENFVKTGKMRLSELPKPDLQCWDILRKSVPAKSVRSFDEHEPGVRAVAGEYFPSAGVQYVVMSAGDSCGMGWKETGRDVTEG